MRRSTWIVAGVCVYAVAGAVVVESIAAWLYFLAIKTVPASVAPGTFLALWDQLADVPDLHHKLVVALAVAGALVYVVAPLVLLSSLQPRRSLHGDARFAREGEVRAAGLFADKGIIVGKLGRRWLTFGGQQFVLVAAPTRTGKTVGVVVPNLLNWSDSAVVLDIKGEVCKYTSGFRAAHGQAVYVFDPYSKVGRTHRWNPFDMVDRDPHRRVGDLQAIAEIFYPTDHHVKEPFWNEQAQNLFVALSLYVMETPSLPFTLGEILRQGSGCGQPLVKHLQSVLAARSRSDNPLSRTCRDALNRFLGNSENTLASIKASFEAPLQPFSNALVDAATSASDFDVRDLRRRPMTIYLKVEPPQLAQASRILNLFFAQLVNLNLTTLPEHDPSLRYQCLLLADEFTAMGRISIISKTVGFMAGYGFRFVPIVQSLEQLEDVYGREAARTLVKNCDLKVFFPPDDPEDAERLSRALGYLSQPATSVGRSRSSGCGRMGVNVSHSENTSEQRRALLLPQEIREMPPDQAIVLKSNVKPILCKKIRYFEEAVFMQRVMPPVELPILDLAAYDALLQSGAPQTPPTAAQGIDMGELAFSPEAIARFTGAPENPTREEATAVVDSFFKQFGWPTEDAAARAASDTAAEEQSVVAQASVPQRAGRIDLSVLEL